MFIFTPDACIMSYLATMDEKRRQDSVFSQPQDCNEKINIAFKDFINKDNRLMKVVDYLNDQKRKLDEFTRNMEEKLSSLSIWTILDPPPEYCCRCDESVYVVVDLNQEPKNGISPVFMQESSVVKVSCSEINIQNIGFIPKSQVSKYVSKNEINEKNFLDDFSSSKQPNTLEEKIQDLASIEKLFFGLDVFCRFIFLQVSLYKDAPLCLVCDSHAVVGHSVSIEDTESYVISADIRRMTIEIAKGTS